MANKWDERKKAQEEEYFLKREKDAIAKLKAEQEKQAQQSIQKTCYMRCPKCGEPLQETTFQKVLVDQCTACHGIWLDPGELETVAGREDQSWLGKLWKKQG